jgi:Ca2+-dependent lipid-binding protein
MPRLNVTIVKATNLRDHDVIGLSDPYVVVEMGGRKYKTRTCDNTLNPVWDEEFAFMVADDNAAQITFRIFDEDIMGDDPMGWAKCSVSNLYRGEKTEKVLILNDCKYGAGVPELTVMLEATDFGKLRSEDP